MPPEFAASEDGQIIVLEPYFGGSHRSFLEGMRKHLNTTCRMLTLPAHGWKWRMRLAAPWLAEEIRRTMPEPPSGNCCLLCSTFVDVATLRGLLPKAWQGIKIATYFHENQFAYPVRQEDPRDLHFAITNLTTANASDRLAFNSAYNLETFLDGCRTILPKAPDMPLPDLERRIRDKSIILPPPLDFSDLDALSPRDESVSAPIILWNHRWEHDKNPERFFTALFALAQQGVDFRLIVLGQSFRQQPLIFAEAQQRLRDRILHFGYVPARAEYIAWLLRADLVVSTANHEFFGLSVLEAVRAGCRPLLPARLSYPELFPSEFLYEEESFTEALAKGLGQKRLAAAEARQLTERFSWPSLAGRFHAWLLPEGNRRA